MDGEVFVPTTGTLLANAQQKQRIFNRKPKVTRPCTYCAETHRPERCDKITSVEERRSILQRQQRCLNCLGLKHTKSQCYSKGHCMKCKRKHHTSICEEKQENPNQSSSYQMKENSNSNSSQPPTHTTAKNTTHMGATHSLHPTNHILMQSAVTKIRGAGKQYRQARILFDTGSQRTFITQDMTHKLELKPTGKELLDVTTFGSFQSTRKTYDIVSFSISTETENITIKALVTPIICPPLSVMEKLKIPPALKGLKLADRLQSPENLDVDIIIGNDYYGQLITGKIIKTENEALIAIESKFGWLLSGPVQNESNHENDLNTLCQRIEITPVQESKLDNLLTKFWEISKIPEESDKNDDIITDFQKTIRFNEATGRYNVRLPWKQNKQAKAKDG